MKTLGLKKTGVHVLLFIIIEVPTCRNS